MKKTILALTLCAVMATALVGCGERRETFPNGSMDTTQTPYTDRDTTMDDRTDTNAGNGAYNGSFGNTGSATNPSAPADGSVTGNTTDGDRVLGRSNRSVLRRGRDLTWEQMLENGRIHDRDGFLLDGENSNW